jgi:predicted membrane channel-forming protein YqfA (hemolysin III family)
MTEEKYTARWDQSKWLVASSSLFLIPAIYAYQNKLYLCSLISTLTTLFSINYWRKATTKSWRKQMDLVFSKISFVIFTYKGIIYVTQTPLCTIGYSNVLAIAYCYYLSEKLFAEKNPNWIKYHAMFHLLVAYGQLIVLHNMTQRFSKSI